MMSDRILVADGTRGVAFLLRDMLPEERTRCVVDVVQGGRGALEQLRKTSNSADVASFS